MAFLVLYDANVLYPAPLRDLLIRIAATGLVQARWTEAILDECFRSILRNRPDLTLNQLQRTRTLMNRAIPDVLISGYETLIEGLMLPDPNDRHVLAAAIRGGVQVIVTSNLKHFPKKALAPYDLEALSPDDFVLDAIDLSPATVLRVVEEQAAALRRPARTPSQLLDLLLALGLPRSVTKLRDAYAGQEPSRSVGRR